MAQKFEIYKGFMRFQRLGPIEFGEQSRWSIRAPESSGLWAFPFPHFDLFYAYHRYMDLLPKDLQGRYPTNPKWWRRKPEKGEPRYEGSYEVPGDYDEEGYYPITSMNEIVFDEDERPCPKNGYVIGAFYRAQENWIETIGKRILPLREFWYRGELYSHFRKDGQVGSWSFDSQDGNNDFQLITTDELAKFMKKPGGVIYFNSYDGAGKPRTANYSKDHLEVFIPRGRGQIVAKKPR